MTCSENLAENFGPIGTLFHAVSILFCLTTSLAHDGAGLGTLGLPESELRKLAADAGFGGFARVPFDSPFHSVYELRA